MKKLTKSHIEQMANEIANYCYEKGYKDVILYYNGKKRYVDYYEHKRDEIIENVDPHDYCEYACYNHILSISSECNLELDYFYGDCGFDGLEKIIKKYGLYLECCTSWFVTCCADTIKDEDIEYTVYERPKKKKYIRTWETYADKRIMGLIEVYKKALAASGYKTNGSCVIGDGINFELDNQPYFMSTNYNQSDVVNEVIEACKGYLITIGAQNIWYDCGRLD